MTGPERDLHANEQTLFKVMRGLRRSGLNEAQAKAAIVGMQAEGILFRELFPTLPPVLPETRWRPIDPDGAIDPTPAPPTEDYDEGETGPPEIVELS